MSGSRVPGATAAESVRTPAESGAIDPAESVRPELRALPAYHLDLSPCRFKLDQNEVPWDLPRRMKRAICERLMALDWARYPDFHAEALRQALGKAHGWPGEGVLVGNGSNELLAITLTALAASGDEILGVSPSFGLYPSFVARTGARFRQLPSGPRFALPLAALEAEVERDPTRPVLLCTPNNPTGAVAAVAAVRRLLERLQAPLLLDNAYGEFCDERYAELLPEFPRLLIFGTFSKAWSLAGLRLGYLLGDRRLIAELGKVKLPYNLGHATAVAGEIVLAHADEARRRVRLLRARRAQWAALLSAAGLEVFPSAANFVLARCGEGASGIANARRLRDGLAAAGIRVRDVGGAAELAGCLRVSVGSGPALRATRAALADLGMTPPRGAA